MGNAASCSVLWQLASSTCAPQVDSSTLLSSPRPMSTPQSNSGQVPFCSRLRAAQEEGRGALWGVFQLVLLGGNPHQVTLFPTCHVPFPPQASCTGWAPAPPSKQLTQNFTCLMSQLELIPIIHHKVKGNSFTSYKKERNCCCHYYLTSVWTFWPCYWCRKQK